MPVIPGRDSLGNAVPRGARYSESNIPRAGGAFADAVYQQGVQQEREARILAAEEARQAKATRIAADKSAALSELQYAADDLDALNRDMTDAVARGDVDKTKANEEWATQARDRIGTALQQAPEAHRGDLQRDLEHRLRRGDLVVRKAVTARDQQDVRAGIDQTIERASRLYATDPAAADQMVSGTIEALGPHSGLPPDQLAKAGQGYRERSRLARADSMVIGAQHDNAALSNVAKALTGDEFAALDPQQRTQIEGRIAILQDRNDRRVQAERERIDRERERQLKTAEAAWNVGNKLSFEGALNPQRAEELLRDMSGTPYAKGFKDLLARQREMGSIASQPPQAIQSALDQVNAKIMKDGVTEELVQMRDKLQTVRTGQLSAINTDGALRAAGAYGVAEPPPPLDFSAGLPAALQQLVERAPAVQAAAQWSGKAELLYPEEAQKLSDHLKVLPAKERAATVSAMAAQVGPDVAKALAAQIDHKDRALALAVTSNQTPQGRYRTELLLRGQQAKADGTSTKGEKVPDVSASNWRATAAAGLVGVFSNADTEAQARDAAELIMHGIAAENGGRLTKEDMSAALSMAIGGTLLEGRGRSLGLRNGREVRAALPLPEGMDEDAFDARLRSVRPEAIWPQIMPALPAVAQGQVRDMKALSVRASTPEGGYASVPVADFIKSLPGAQLMPAKPGQYAVIVNGRPVVNDAGTPILIGVR